MWLDSPNPLMPRIAVAPAIPASRARATMASTSGWSSKVSLAPIWMRRRAASPGICIAIAGARSRLCHEIEPQPRFRPFHRGELPRCRQGDIGGLQVRAAEADIGRVDVRHLDL